MAKPASNSHKELISRLWYLVFALIIYRIGVHIPVPGVDHEKVRQLFNSGDGSIFQLFNMFSGGALSNASLLALGVAPYISASIVLQLFTHMYPPLKELRQQGSSGQKKISQYTRYLALVFALVQGFAISRMVMAQGLTLFSGQAFLITGTICLATGALFMMWLGEQITERGIGNGVSMLIFAGIAVHIPAGIANLVSQTKDGNISFLGFFLMLFIIVALFGLIVFVERAQRQIAIHYAKRQGMGMQTMGQRSHLPLKINMAGVIPAIFASAIITLLVSLFALLGASYAHDCYPSYFTAAPALDNARLVSLLNTLLGGPVFGCIWNLNLTKRTQGVSHLVCILLNGFSIMSNVALLSACMPFREQTGLA